MNWKDKIEAQIAWLAMEPWARTQDCAQVMRDLLDVAVAADEYCTAPGLGVGEGRMMDALDKLREVKE